MWKIFLFIPLLLPACIVGKAGNFALDEDLPQLDLERLQKSARGKAVDAVLEERVYSIPIIPIFSGYRWVKKNPFQNQTIRFHAMKSGGLFYTLLYGESESSRFDERGKNQSYDQSRALLLGLLFRSWHGWKKESPGLEGENYNGFSIAWGLFKSETIYGESKLTLFWIPF